jgi:hypothetical protein
MGDHTKGEDVAAVVEQGLPLAEVKDLGCNVAWSATAFELILVARPTCEPEVAEHKLT